MEDLIGVLGLFSGMTAPVLALWAVVGLYTQAADCRCPLPKLLYFLALIVVAALTIRAACLEDSAWLTQAASLGGLVVAGVMRRPGELASSASALVPN